MKSSKVKGLRVVENLGHAHRVKLPKSPVRTAVCVVPLPGGDATTLAADVLNALDRRSWSKAISAQKEDPEMRAALWLRTAEIQNLIIVNADWMNDSQWRYAARLGEVCAVWTLFADTARHHISAEFEYETATADQLATCETLRVERPSAALDAEWGSFPDPPECGPLEFRAACESLLTGQQLKLVDDAMSVGGSIAMQAISGGGDETVVNAQLRLLGDNRWSSLAIARGAQLAALNQGWRLNLDLPSWEASYSGSASFSTQDVKMLSSIYDPYVAGMYVVMRATDLGPIDLQRLSCGDLSIDGNRVTVGGRGLSLPIELMQIVKALEIEQAEGRDQAEPLFRTRNGKAMRPSGIRQRLTTFCDRTALSRPMSMTAGRDRSVTRSFSSLRPLEPLVVR